ncbi:helix-turn-helix domain-containing protein [Frankia sp. Cj5]|uniref:helix-turn-helix domain-containing protein n=1 Tax=Frankia sp. Cj5 TaxID=2880978 RepID=UPI00351CD852
MRPPAADRVAEATAFFDGGRLTLARQLAGLRKSDLAAAVGKSPTAVAAWESGAKRPAAATVAQLALSLSVEPGFFSVRPDDVAALSTTPHFRSLRSTTQLARDQAFAFGQVAVDIATSLEKHVEFPEPSVPTLPVVVDDRDDDGPERAAQLIREQWGMAAGPAGHLVRLLENHGVLVVFSPLRTSSVDAYSFDSRLRPVVVLNPIKRDYYRQRFDVAHELGHLVMHSDAEPGGRIVEDQAYRFAAELLMPAEQLRDLLPAVMDGKVWRTLARLKEQWGVSIQALLYRARWLGRLSDVSYRNAMTTISARGWRRDEPGLMSAIEQPSLLPKAIELLAQEGIDETQLIEQCRVPVDLFRTVTARTPDSTRSETVHLHGESGQRGDGRVVSLLERHQTGRPERSDESEVAPVRQNNPQHTVANAKDDVTIGNGNTYENERRW